MKLKFLNRTCSTSISVMFEQPEPTITPDYNFEATNTEPISERCFLKGGRRIKGLLKNNGKENPLVTVITVVYNGSEYLEQVILSVLNQSYENVEYIIIDGGSTDGTLDILRKYDNDIDYWESKSDLGIYNAINKGMALSRGDWIGIINADDFYFPDAISRCVAAFKEGSDFVYGSVVKVGGKHPPTISSPLPTSQMLSRGLQEMPVPHVSLFIHKRVFLKVGIYNEKFSICADHDLILRIFRAGFNGFEIPFPPLAILMRGGVSDSWRIMAEQFVIARQYGRSNLLAITVLIFQLINRIINSTTFGLIGVVKKRYFSTRHSTKVSSDLIKSAMLIARLPNDPS